MPIFKIEITNPEAIELIRKIKTGEIFTPTLDWLKKNKQYFFAAGIVIVLITALVVGKKLSERSALPAITPPEIDSPIPTVIQTIKSDYSGLKEEIQNLNTDLPDPYIPTFDNEILLM